jgi:hypothetical protein
MSWVPRDDLDVTAELRHAADLLDQVGERVADPAVGLRSRELATAARSLIDGSGWEEEARARLVEARDAIAAVGLSAVYRRPSVAARLDDALSCLRAALADLGGDADEPF